MKRGRTPQFGVVTLLGTAGLFLIYVRFLRPWHLRWGASGEETEASIPGDELIADLTLVSTRAVTIVASSEAVWQWLAQIGQGARGKRPLWAFWRTLFPEWASGESPKEDLGLKASNEAFNRAETSARLSLYETEGHRFESCRAR